MKRELKKEYDDLSLMEKYKYEQKRFKKMQLFFNASNE